MTIDWRLKMIAPRVERASSRNLFAPRLAVLLVACALLAACEHTSSRPAASASGTASQSSGDANKINKDWGSCQYRRCGYGK